MTNDVLLGVQSFCFRNEKNNDKVASMVKEIGLAAIEVCAVHVNFAETASFGTAIESYRKQGVSIISIGVNSLTGDELKDRPQFEFLKACGAKYMSVSFGIEDAIKKAHLGVKLAEEYDVKLAIHNHGGKHWLGNSEALRWIFKNTSSRMGLNLDTAWALDAGEDVIKMITTFKDRLHLLHLKDFTFDSARKHKDVVVGSGNINLDAVKKTLDEIGFNGIAVIEYEGDPANPVPPLRECVKAVRAKIQFKT